MRVRREQGGWPLLVKKQAGGFRIAATPLQGRRGAGSHRLEAQPRRVLSPDPPLTSFELSRYELSDPGMREMLSVPGAVKSGYLLITPLKHEARWLGACAQGQGCGADDKPRGAELTHKARWMGLTHGATCVWRDARGQVRGASKALCWRSQPGSRLRVGLAGHSPSHHSASKRHWGPQSTRPLPPFGPSANALCS